jgi:hypothetical protein
MPRRALDATLTRRRSAPRGSKRRVEHHAEVRDATPRGASRNELAPRILGGQDGLVNILGIVLGVIAGGVSTSVLLATGFAAAITESISMGAVGYTSSVEQRDYYNAERHERRPRSRTNRTPSARRPGRSTERRASRATCWSRLSPP